MSSHRPETAPAGLRADAWLCKPFELGEFCRAVETWVGTPRPMP